jgi:hypothetical protein
MDGAIRFHGFSPLLVAKEAAFAQSLSGQKRTGEYLPAVFRAVLAEGCLAEIGSHPYYRHLIRGRTVRPRRFQGFAR